MIKIKLFLLRDEGATALNNIALALGISDQNYQAGINLIWEKYISSLIQTAENLRTPGGYKLKCIVHSRADLEIAKQRLIGNQPVISLDAYGSMSGQTSLGVSRIFSPRGQEKLAIGSRPGYPSLSTQIKGLNSRQSWVLVEDDIFSGGTICYILDLLKKHHIKILKVVVGCQVGEPKSIVIIESVFKYEASKIHDLNDPRDFLLGTREGGLVIKDRDSLYRVPYLLPLIDVSKRIGVSSSEGIKFSKTLWKINQGVFTQLEKLSGKSVQIKHLGKFVGQYLVERLSFSYHDSVIDLCKQFQLLQSYKLQLSWGGVPDSNRQPLDPQSSALPLS